MTVTRIIKFDYATTDIHSMFPEEYTKEVMFVRTEQYLSFLLSSKIPLTKKKINPPIWLLQANDYETQTSWNVEFKKKL